MTGAVGARRAWRSTRGGRSVQRTATALQGASLRTVPLVRAATLTALANPLAPLLAGPPDLSVLGETAARAGGGGAASENRRRPAPRLAQPAAGSGARPATPLTSTARRTATTWPSRPAGTADGSAATSGPRTGLAAAARAGLAPPDPTPAGRTPSAGTPLPAVRAEHSPADVAPQTAPEERGLVGPVTGSVPTPAVALGRIDAAALAAAARTGAAPATPAGNPPAGPAAAVPDTEPVTERATGGGLPAPDRDEGTDTTTPPGALGELLGRWHDASPVEPSPIQARSIPFAPLTSAASTGFATSADELGSEGLALDRVEEALEELLRREAERHGLGGGLV